MRGRKFQKQKTNSKRIKKSKGQWRKAKILKREKKLLHNSLIKKQNTLLSLNPINPNSDKKEDHTLQRGLLQYEQEN